MKKTLLSLTILFALVWPLSAQMSVSCGSPNVSLLVKRSIAQGDDVYVDMILTGTGRMTKIYISNNSEAYDDEGNKYYVNNTDMPFTIQFDYDQRRGETGFWLDIPKDVPRKVRMRMLGADEYASSFALIKMMCDGDDGSHFTIIIKNLPISR